MKRLLSLLLVLLFLLAGCSQIPAEPSTVPSEPTAGAEAETLYVHFIDVGQADCTLLQYGDQFALVDGGNTDDSGLVANYLKQLGAERLDLVVGTHPHEDHIGGLAYVLNHFPADEVWSGPITYTNSVVDRFLSGAAGQGLTVQYPDPGHSITLGDVSITVLGPVREDYEDVNDLSLVLMVQYGDIRFLLTGDMESIAESDLIDSGADIRADVLKVGHHGSYSSSSYRFLKYVSAKYAVIPVGRDNEYGHPHENPLSRLIQSGANVYRTDQMGTVVAACNGEDVHFIWMNPDALPGGFVPLPKAA